MATGRSSNEGKFHVSDASPRDAGHVARDLSRLFQGRLLLLRLAGLLPCHVMSRVKYSRSGVKKCVLFIQSVRYHTLCEISH